MQNIETKRIIKALNKLQKMKAQCFIDCTSDPIKLSIMVNGEWHSICGGNSPADCLVTFDKLGELASTGRL